MKGINVKETSYNVLMCLCIGAFSAFIYFASDSDFSMTIITGIFTSFFATILFVARIIDSGDAA